MLSISRTTWRATQRLTLNLGLRWDGIPHTVNPQGQVSNFYPNLYAAEQRAYLAHPRGHHQPDECGARYQSAPSPGGVSVLH